MALFSYESSAKYLPDERLKKETGDTCLADYGRNSILNFYWLKHGCIGGNSVAAHVDRHRERRPG